MDEDFRIGIAEVEFMLISPEGEAAGDAIEFGTRKSSRFIGSGRGESAEGDAP